MNEPPLNITECCFVNRSQIDKLISNKSNVVVTSISEDSKRPKDISLVWALSNMSEISVWKRRFLLFVFFMCKSEFSSGYSLRALRLLRCRCLRLAWPNRPRRVSTIKPRTELRRFWWTFRKSSRFGKVFSLSHQTVTVWQANLAFCF